MSINKYHIQVVVVELVLLFFAGAAVFGGAWVQTLPQRARAQSFLRDVSKLEVGKSTFEDAKLVARKDGGIPWWVSDDSMQCTYERCVFRFVFENKPLTSTRLVPYVGLIAMLTIKNGIVVGREISYARNDRSAVFHYEVNEAAFSDGADETRKHSPGLIRASVDRDGVPSGVWVYLDPSSQADQRQRAYALDVSCLSRIFGCSSPSAIFPRGVPYRDGPVQTHTQEW
jgi:hypothetical protein